MGLIVTDPPTAEPISLAEAKAHCRVYGADDDGLLAGYIMAARAHAEVYTRRALMTQTLALTIDGGWPDDQIVLPKPPLQSVTSITYVDATGAVQTLAADQYRVDTTAHEGFIERAYGVSWPSVRRQSRTIVVTYVAGYTQIPEPIRQAMLLLIGHFYENREAVNVGNIVTEFPLGVDALLFPYRVFY